MKGNTMKKFTIIVGKSASGKTTLANHIVKTTNNCRKYKTTTTRPKRFGEGNSDYDFISTRKFLNKLAKGKFVEYNAYNVINNGEKDVWYYGTPIFYNLKLNNANYVIVLTLDGAMEFKKYYGSDKCEIVYLECSDDIRELRARQRGSFELKEWERRLKADEEDFARDKVILNCDRIVNVNGKTIEELTKEIVNE